MDTSVAAPVSMEASATAPVPAPSVGADAVNTQPVSMEASATATAPSVGADAASSSKGVMFEELDIVVRSIESHLEMTKSHHIDWSAVAQLCEQRSGGKPYEPLYCQCLWRFAAYAEEPKKALSYKYDSDEEDFLLHPKQYSGLMLKKTGVPGADARSFPAVAVDRVIEKAHRVWLRRGDADVDREVSLAMLTARTEPFLDLLKAGEAKEKAPRAAGRKKRRSVY